MILYYCVGDGYGHVARALAVVHTLDLDPSNVTLLTNNRAAEDPRVNGGCNVQLIPETEISRKALWPLIKDIVQGPDVETLFVDVFPGGVAGELCGIGVRVPMHYVGRWLNWARYRGNLAPGPIHYTTAYLTEPLHPDQMAYIRGHAEFVRSLELVDPPVDPDPDDVAALEVFREERPVWLVVKSQPETAKRMAHEALSRAWTEEPKPKVVLICPERPEGLNPAVGHMAAYPAYPLYHLADKLFLPATQATYRQTRDYEGDIEILAWNSMGDDPALREAWHIAGFTGETFG
jgi:hypothetical protein